MVLRMLLGSCLHPTPHTRELAHKAEAKHYATEHRVVHTQLDLEVLPGSNFAYPGSLALPDRQLLS